MTKSMRYDDSLGLEVCNDGSDYSQTYLYLVE